MRSPIVFCLSGRVARFSGGSVLLCFLKALFVDRQSLLEQPVAIFERLGRAKGFISWLSVLWRQADNGGLRVTSLKSAPSI